MDFFIDFIPALPFILVAFRVIDIFFATQLAIGLGLLQVVFSRIRYKRIKPLHGITFLMLLVMGGATILFQDERIIKFKPTVLNAGLSLGFLLAPILFKTNIPQLLLGEKMFLPTQVWGRLNNMWAGYFAIIAILNTYIALSYSTEDWAQFRTFGLYGGLLIFTILQMVYLFPHIKEQNIAENAQTVTDTDKHPPKETRNN